MRSLWRLALGLPLLATGCVQLAYHAGHVDQPIEDAVFESLIPQQVGLQECLDALGAPHLVQEYQVHGMTMAWGWLDRSAFGLRVSYGIENAPSVSFSWDSDNRAISGIVLFFDKDLRLELVRRGSLQQILPSRRPPATIEEIEKS